MRSVATGIKGARHTNQYPPRTMATTLFPLPPLIFSCCYVMGMLKEWVAKQAEREREKEERRRLRKEKRERLLAEPQPKLEDPTYHEQYAKAQEDLQSALQAGEQCGSGADDSNSSSKSGSQGFIVSMEQECTDESLKTVNEEKDQPTLTQGQGSVTSASLVNAHNGASKEQQGENGEKPRPTSDLQEQKHSLLSSLPAPAKSSSIEKSSDGDMGPIDLDQYSSADELEPLGLEHLKVELMRRGLKCGGTIEERAQRLFSIKGLSPDQINPKLLAKPAKGKGQGKNRQ
ncbi:hypothetical protein BaRGS_00035840 [Batillaria attramentaria]|uniref:SDE2/SF3A3 SAP domain-containing protein n=1 Tax=Batillaria attramentaria TaxID=370345 RepID=A0ABD0JDN7_9CAEN